jgi:hypothetical protein
MNKIEYPGIAAERVALLFDCFAALGTLKQYGQTDLAHEMKVRPQIIRRRAADARHDRNSRGMPIDQVKQVAKIAVREIPPLKETKWQAVVAWLLGLDDLIEKNTLPDLEKWRKNTDPRGSIPDEPKKKR